MIELKVSLRWRRIERPRNIGMNDSATLMYNVRLFARENQTRRLYLLRKLYDWGMGHPCIVPISFLSDAPEWIEFDILDVAGYLAEEGLLEIGSDKEQDRPPVPNLCLTHKGIVEVERSIDHPTGATEHFSAQIVQHFNAPVGSVQSGVNSTASSTQHLRKARKST
jgi:hypothetical protein